MYQPKGHKGYGGWMIESIASCGICDAVLALYVKWQDEIEKDESINGASESLPKSVSEELIKRKAKAATLLELAMHHALGCEGHHSLS
jgi:hypothetical protein